MKAQNLRWEDVDGRQVIRPRWTHRDAVEALWTPGGEPTNLKPSDDGYLPPVMRMERSSQRVIPPFSEQGGMRWDGGSLEDARRLLQDGWREEVGRLVVEPKLRSGEVNRAKSIRAPFGGVVDPGRFAAGRIDCMRAKRRQPMTRPLVRIGIDWAVPFTTSADDMLAVGRTVHTVVASLKARGFPTEVWVCAAIEGRGQRAGFTGSARYGDSGSRPMCDTRVLVQASNAPTHGARLAYWLCHPTVLRRALFALWETLPVRERATFQFYCGGGYGGARPGWAKDEFSEWAPSAALGVRAAADWAAEVLGRRS